MLNLEMSQNWILKAGAGFLAAAFLTSCSPAISSDSGTTDASSTTQSSITGAECNAFSAGTSLNGKLTTYYSAGALQADRVRLRINGIDSRFSTSSTTYIQFFRWTSDANGVTQLDSSPLSFSIEKGSTNSQTISSVMTSLNISALTSIRSNGAVAGSTAQDFFNNTIFTVTGLDSSWAAMKAVLYDGTTAIAQADVLLPIFAANPNTYALHYPPVLSNLHPLNSLRGSTMADAEWLARTKTNCF